MTPAERLARLRRDRIQAAAYERETRLYTKLAGNLKIHNIPYNPPAKPGKEPKQ